jgi:hypothetical protein
MSPLTKGTAGVAATVGWAVSSAEADLLAALLSPGFATDGGGPDGAATAAFTGEAASG